jgi:hypothetical protein
MPFMITISTALGEASFHRRTLEDALQAALELQNVGIKVVQITDEAGRPISFDVFHKQPRKGPPKRA